MLRTGASQVWPKLLLGANNALSVPPRSSFALASRRDPCLLAGLLPPSLPPLGRGSRQQGAAPEGTPGRLRCVSPAAVVATCLSSRGHHRPPASWHFFWALRAIMLPRQPARLLFSLLLLLLLLGCGAAQEEEEVDESKSETPLRTLQLETLVAAPDGCTEHSAVGDTLQIHYTGTLENGRIIDTSLSRDPLQVELGKRQVIPGLEQGLLDMCVGEKRKVIIPPHLAYGKRGSPPSIPEALQSHVVLHHLEDMENADVWAGCKKLWKWAGICPDWMPAWSWSCIV
ncbi:peptidyl-prolyl cis-trans isomerase FKBP11 isoform X3 [Hemicordylus capensis]|uniref:peptidyl-prolyl cis-trans isomerase FKBP11 isoform X3 n=1 Tax=Hemicordylus capensis TaxID=884348 RepID=UPI0023034980|nr:peptidyl-prolyl cis-trans isomerase FKBP11 isoform X3 [Hemicordylus capensis]